MDKLKLAQLKVLPRFVLEERRHFFRENAEKIAQAASNKTKGRFKNASSCSSAVLKIMWVLENIYIKLSIRISIWNWKKKLHLKKSHIRLVMSVVKTESRLECWPIRKLSFEIWINFHTLT